MPQSRSWPALWRRIARKQTTGNPWFAFVREVELFGELTDVAEFEQAYLEQRRWLDRLGARGAAARLR